MLDYFTGPPLATHPGSAGPACHLKSPSPVAALVVHQMVVQLRPTNLYCNCSLWHVRYLSGCILDSSRASGDVLHRRDLGGRVFHMLSAIVFVRFVNSKILFWRSLSSDAFLERVQATLYLSSLLSAESTRSRGLHAVLRSLRSQSGLCEKKRHSRFRSPISPTYASAGMILAPETFDRSTNGIADASQSCSRAVGRRQYCVANLRSREGVSSQHQVLKVAFNQMPRKR
jgi:hypothetical protein